ncbi:hypothetical membrane protein [Fulvimarina pelagi HTCC2506]|uniref:Hypothetical membrane protein n=2 Tax=Fulvimarina pelagi TaxID=217511 RepID=Q0FYF7_9HYPH|nr:DUF2231 domain-containing protein [Fulvimarina pelagi]EAU40038.1 hypothetical membrane protein [Fulvimarina pelagi HTCC2506]BAT31080.1 hypothetical membrane protein [Fulvimarina pelagi]
MDYPHPHSTASIGGQPVHAMFSQFPTVCFSLALLTDIFYVLTTNLMWQDFSAWLLLAGLVFGGIALVAGIIDLIGSRGIREQSSTWPYAVGFLAAMLLAFVNSLVHAGDGWTAVMPWGLALSVVTVIVVAMTSWLGRSLVFKYGVGVSNYE